MSNEIKDLMAMKEEFEADIQAEQKIKRETPARVELIPEEVIVGKAREESPVPKEKKKYFKYENGRVIYMEPNKEQSNKWEEIKDSVKDKVKGREKTINPNHQNIIRGVLIIIVMVLLYVALHSMLAKDKEDRIYFPADTGNVVAEAPAPGQAETLDEVAEKPADEKPVAGITREEADYLAKIQEINTKERDKVMNYMTGLGNRGAVISHIERAITQKKDMYRDLGSDNEMSGMIVNSLAMSQEFLTSFDEKNVKASLEEVLRKYE